MRLYNFRAKSKSVLPATSKMSRVIPGTRSLMRILLIGGNGFIGSPLVRESREMGHQLAIFHRRPEAAAPATADLVRIQGDRNRLADSREQIRQFSPDVIVDLILSSGEQARQLMILSRELTQRVVAISSMDVYRAWGVMHEVEPGGLQPLPLTEDSQLRTVRRLYPPETIRMMQGIFTWVDENYDKIAVEESIMNYARLPGTVLRLPMVYGPGDPLHRWFPLLKRIADGRSTILIADDFAAWRAPRGYVDNVAHAIALAATSDQAAGRIYNICEEPSLSELAWQRKITAQTNWPGQFIVLPRSNTPKHLVLPGNAAQHVVASSERIRTELGYEEPVEIDEAIRRTIAWEQKNPPSTINPQQFDYDAEDAALADGV
jgi:nucleoside-diphosphate-sugar epimerase